jgi:hypothetical protein
MTSVSLCVLTYTMTLPPCCHMSWTGAESSSFLRAAWPSTGSSTGSRDRFSRSREAKQTGNQKTVVVGCCCFVLFAFHDGVDAEGGAYFGAGVGDGGGSESEHTARPQRRDEKVAQQEIGSAKAMRPHAETMSFVDTNKTNRRKTSKHLAYDLRTTKQKII